MTIIFAYYDSYQNTFPITFKFFGFFKLLTCVNIKYF